MFVHIQFPQWKVKYENSKELRHGGGLQATTLSFGRWTISYSGFHEAQGASNTSKKLCSNTKLRNPFSSLVLVSQCYPGPRTVVPVHYSMSMNIFAQKAPFNSLQLSYDTSIFFSISMICSVLPKIQARWCQNLFSFETKCVKAKSSLLSIFQIKKWTSILQKNDFTLGTSNPTGILRPLHNPLRCNHLDILNIWAPVSSGHVLNLHRLWASGVDN